jgi:hypothetical protein
MPGKMKMFSLKEWIARIGLERKEHFHDAAD